MGQIEIIRKLNDLFARHSDSDFAWSEKEVVYVLVELRKLLYHLKAMKSFAVIKFYADWSVHIDKNHVPDELKSFFQSEDNIRTLISMDFLRSSLIELLASNQIYNRFNNDEYWTDFRNNLHDVLSEQPLEVNLPVQRVLFWTTETGRHIEFDYS